MTRSELVETLQNNDYIGVISGKTLATVLMKAFEEINIAEITGRTEDFTNVITYVRYE